MEAAAFLVGTAVIGGVHSGINNAMNGNKIRQGICNTNKQIDTVSKAYDALLSSQDAEIETLQSTFTTAIRNLATEKAILTTLRDNYAKSRNQMIIASILFVTSIIVSFLFKEFGFFNLVYDSIFGSPKQIK